MVERIGSTKAFRPRRWDGLLNERYYEFRYLSHGRQGDLYVARDKLNDGALVAIKFLVQETKEKLVDLCGVVKKKDHERSLIYQWLFEGEIQILVQF